MILNDGFALKFGNYRTLNILYVSNQSKKFLYYTAMLVQPPYIASHSL